MGTYVLAALAAIELYARFARAAAGMTEAEQAQAWEAMQADVEQALAHWRRAKQQAAGR